MLRRLTLAIVWIIQRTPFLKRWILNRPQEKKEYIDPNKYTLY
ncbi:MAG: hypothetical protein PHX20_04210 [Candidatus Omnitrophica bacterium]|nr:hypothetical protein [Candidatus Omnitrophota bacterium]MDD5436730.1 hypothetical protein [Candidatus Omnitrophota bacterium]